MKMVHIVGNRPQFIKLSVLQQALSQRLSGPFRVIHTGQHFSDNMSAVFFAEFGLPQPDHQLNINNLPHNQMIGAMLGELDRVLAVEAPGAVIVYGDTNSTLAGALAAKKRNIPVIHVEAGIRTGMEDMPEESNRYLTDRLATLNFACTTLGVAHCRAEGLGHTVHHTGDLMLDSALRFRGRAMAESRILGEIFPAVTAAGSGAGLMLEAVPAFVLATIHRAEHTEDPAVLSGILAALDRIAEDMPVVFPAHPKTRQLIDRLGGSYRFRLLPPLGYLDMLALVQSCSFVITDSGGLSREAFFFQRPSLVVMRSAFWPEIFQHGPSLPAVAERDAILAGFAGLQGALRPFEPGVFGDGQAAVRMSDLIAAKFNLN